MASRISQAPPRIAVVPYTDRHRTVALAMLIAVYTLNFLDRQIIGILAVPIKADLGLTDVELGLMGGLAFALFYTALGIPIAMLADRRDRAWIMTIALTIWSAMTAVCGFAQNFWQLFAARLGVGIGEAGGVAPAYTLIADLYPPERRASALGIYSFGIPIGSASGIVLGGVIATLIDWRYAFFIVGLAGVILAPIFKLVVREPGRGRHDPGPVLPPSPLRGVLAVLLRKPSFWLLCLGSASSSMIGYGMMFWLPSLLVRSYGLSLLDASLGFGTVLLVGGIVGIWGGGVLADRLGRSSKTAYAMVPAVAFLVTGPFYVLAMLADDIWLVLPLLILPSALGVMWLGPVLAALQQLVPPAMRTTTSAIYLFIANLLGLGVGTPAIGGLSDMLKVHFGADSLRYSVIAGCSFYLLAAMLMALAAKRLERDWHRAEAA